MYSDFYQDENFEDSLSDFEDALQKQQAKYFEVHELEFIVDYYFSINNLDNAQKALEVASQMHPNSYELKKRKAQLFNLKGQFYLAYQEIESAVASYGTSEDIDYYMILGEALVGLQNYEEGKKAFQEALSLADEEVLEIASSIAVVYQQHQKHHEAIEYLEIAVKGDTMLLFDLALSYQNIEDYAKATTYCQKFLRQEPYSFDAWFLLYHLSLENDDLQNAEEALLNTIAIVPNLSVYKYELASFYTENERFVEALEVYKEIMEQSQDVELDVLLAVADIFLMIDEPEKALKNYYHVLRLSPYHAKALSGIAKVKMEQEEYDVAIGFIKQALKEEPSNPEYWLCLADIWSFKEDLKEADKIYKQVLAKHVHFEEAWERYFDFLFFNQDYPKAIAIAYEAIRNGVDRNLLEYKMVAAYAEMEVFHYAEVLLTSIMKQNKKILNDFKAYYPQWEDVLVLKNIINKNEGE